MVDHESRDHTGKSNDKIECDQPVNITVKIGDCQRRVSLGINCSHNSRHIVGPSISSNEAQLSRRIKPKCKDVLNQGVD